MVQVIPFEDPGDYKRTLHRIKRLWREGAVEILPHAQRRMIERRIEMTDIEHLIRYGCIVDHSKDRENWRYVVEGRTVDGTKADVVVEIDVALLIVTVRGRKRGR